MPTSENLPYTEINPNPFDLGPLTRQVAQVTDIMRIGIEMLISHLEAYGSPGSNVTLKDLLGPIRVLLDLGDGELAQLLEVRASTVARWRDGTAVPHPAIWPTLRRHLIDDAERKLRILSA